MGRKAKLRQEAQRWRDANITPLEYGTWSPEYLDQCTVMKRHPETGQPIVLFNFAEKRFHFDPDCFSPDAIEYAIKETFVRGVERGTLNPENWK